VVKELTFATDTVVFGVDDSFNEIFRVTVNDDRQWRGLFLIDERVGVFGLQL
jgi:hypothetical protein